MSSDSDSNSDREEFDPYSRPSHRIRDILSSRPTHVVLTELLQNADDAGATHVSFLLDLCDAGDEQTEHIGDDALLVRPAKPSP